MVDMELLQAIETMMGKMMDSKLEPIYVRLDGIDGRLDGIDERLDRMDVRLDGIDERLERLEEDSVVTRNGVNTLLDWAEQVETQVKIPLYKKVD